MLAPSDFSRNVEHKAKGRTRIRKEEKLQARPLIGHPAGGQKRAGNPPGSPKICA
jgi:hypothetical protein